MGKKHGWVDATIPLQEGLPVWPDDAPVRIWQTAEHAPDGLRVTALSLSAHAGTHVDAPLHVFANGTDVSAYPAKAFLGPAMVLGEPLPTHARRVLLRGPLTREQAEALCHKRLLLVGVQGASIDIGDELGAHRVFLAAGVAVVEHLDLTGVPDGPCRLCCLPLHIPGADGAPARCLIRPRRA